MILLHKFISMKPGIYSAGFYLRLKKYYRNTIVASRGKFKHDNTGLYSCMINYSPIICVEIYPHTHKICFDNRNFIMDLIFEKETHYNIYVHFYIGTYLNINILTEEEIETQAAIYKSYYDIGKDNTE